MLKAQERDTPSSCWNKARDDQMVFVLIEGDPAAPGAIMRWIAERIAQRKNRPGDVKTTNALNCARYMAKAAGVVLEFAEPDLPLHDLAGLQSILDKMLEEHGGQAFLKGVAEALKKLEGSESIVRNQSLAPILIGRAIESLADIDW